MLTLCEIWGSHDSENQDYGLVRCYFRLGRLGYVTDMHKVKRKLYTVSIKDIGEVTEVIQCSIT